MEPPVKRALHDPDRVTGGWPRSGSAVCSRSAGPCRVGACRTKRRRRMPRSSTATFLRGFGYMIRTLPDQPPAGHRLLRVVRCLASGVDLLASSSRRSPCFPCSRSLQRAGAACWSSLSRSPPALLVPAFVQGYSVHQTGIIWQGRYGLFLYLGIMVVAAWLLSRDAPVRSTSFAPRAAWGSAGPLIAAFGVLAYLPRCDGAVRHRPRVPPRARSSPRPSGSRRSDGFRSSSRLRIRVCSASSHSSADLPARRIARREVADRVALASPDLRSPSAVLRRAPVAEQPGRAPRVAIAYDCFYPVHTGGGERVYPRMAELLVVSAAPR